MAEGTEVQGTLEISEDDIRFAECEFTVERITHEGPGVLGAMSNGSTEDEQRITFKGFVTPNIRAALAESIEKMMSNDSAE